MTQTGTNRDIMTITRPESKDQPEAAILFHESIRDAFIRNNFPPEEAELEANYKIESLRHDIDTSGKEQFFLIAKCNGRIVGSVALRKSSSFVRQNIPEKYHELKVITSLLVLPEYQRKGIGRKLFGAAVMALLAQHEEAFILDCGYPTAQKFWTSIVGKPYSIKHNLWYGTIDHYFWVKKIENVAINLDY